MYKDNQSNKHCAVQSQKALSAYLYGEQILAFGFTEQRLHVLRFMWDLKYVMTFCQKKVRQYSGFDEICQQNPDLLNLLSWSSLSPVT